MLLPIIWLCDHPYYVYFSFLLLPTYIVYRLFGFEAIFKWYFTLWPAIAIYFLYAHGHRAFMGDFAKETLTYGLPLMPIAILLSVCLFKKIGIHNAFTLLVATLSNMLVSFWFIYDWYLGFLKKLPRNPIPEKVAALFWREDWWLLGAKTMPMLVGSIGLMILIYKGLRWVNREILIPRRQNKKKRMLEKLQKEFGTANISQQQTIPSAESIQEFPGIEESGKIKSVNDFSNNQGSDALTWSTVR